MSFYSPSDSKFTRHYREEVEMAFSAIDCVLHRDHVIYASSEISSGFRLFATLRDQGLKNADELKQKMGEAWYESTIVGRNTKAAVLFTESIRSRLTDRTMVVTPAPFQAPGWTQPEYLAFWEELLRTRIKSVWFNQNWQFSNGCTFEFAVALDARLPTLDHAGKSLSQEEGIDLIRRAIQELDRDGFDTGKLRQNLALAKREPAPYTAGEATSG